MQSTILDVLAQKKDASDSVLDDTTILEYISIIEYVEDQLSESLSYLEDLCEILEIEEGPSRPNDLISALEESIRDLASARFRLTQLIKGEQNP